jgi:hypothetical protein
VKDPVFPVTAPPAETLAALRLLRVTFPAESAPVKEEVALPVTWRFEVVATPETMRLVVEAEEVAMRVPMVPCPMEARFAVKLVVAVRLPKVAFPVFKVEPD